MKKFSVTMSLGAAGLATLLLLPVQGCTDLTENPPSLIASDHFFRDEAEVLAGLAGVYAQLRSTAPEGGIYDANEVSTDEIVVPIRGKDWNDNGQWIDLHNQTWTPTSAATLNFFNGAWNSAYTGVARANLFLAAVANSTAPIPNKAAIIGEVRTLRAFYYYILMDQFGGVPIVTTTEVALRPRNTRREVFDFIERELIAARDSGLPATRLAADNGRITQGAADAILASLYVNAGVFTKDGAAGGINATGYNSCAGVAVTGGDACAAAILAANRILNSGNYSLADSFPQSFRFDNNKSKENIFVVKFINEDQLGMGVAMASLHYCQYSANPWNGFSTLAQTYNSFNPADKRRQAILIGPQRDVLTGALVTFRVNNACPAYSPANALVFTDSIRDIRDASESEGPRPYKWPADPGHVNQNSGNDYAWFRLGEIYLIKAEAEHATGQDGPALIDLNLLRARTDPVAPALAAVSDSVILSERLFELFGEGKRRQDLIRFGKYTARTDAASGLVNGKVASGAAYVLFPIPQTQIDANPNLIQNPGY
jgi:hypothetical protein